MMFSIRRISTVEFLEKFLAKCDSLRLDVSSFNNANEVDTNELLNEQNSKQSDKLLNNINVENIIYDQTVHTD